MSRRVQSEGADFGSDSFLDIIANIVGILIILIVVAGARVARQGSLPVATTALAADVAEPDAGDEPASAEDRRILAELAQQIQSLTLDLEQARATTVSSEAELSDLLRQQETALQQDQLQTARTASLDSETDRLTQTVFQLQTQLLTADEQAHAYRTTLASLSQRQHDVTDALKLVAGETQQLREVLEDNQKQQESTADRLQHRLSPVSESVVENELHFRLCDGRIAHIPLDALLERLKDQVSARRDMVLKFHRYQGAVGPVGGFHMKYTVERRSLSGLEAVRMGQTGWHISVSRWVIEPGQTLQAETVDEALKLGSRFRQVLEAVPTDTTITIWIYPNDFKDFHRLRELAHGLNLRVAARPLPEGVAISGSPSGSQSTSQ
ncbi:MAG: hypothetical protein R3C49_07050 [Planctomycetaceae bacterium]